MKTNTKMGRPKKDPIRNKQIRYGRISDDLLSCISEFESEKDKKIILELLHNLKQPLVTK